MRALFLAAVICFFLRGDAAPTAHHITRPRPLDNPSTWNNLLVMAKHAQQRDRDHQTRLIPVFPKEKLTEAGTCCINARILDYYLSNILNGIHAYPRINQVHDDLKRVALDLEPHCKSPKFEDHEHTKKFKDNYRMLGKIYMSETVDIMVEQKVAKVNNKAVGEIDILFHYLFESCTSAQ